MKNDMWEHYCRQEKTTLYTEKGCGCNWCDMTEEDANTPLQREIAQEYNTLIMLKKEKPLDLSTPQKG